MSDIDLIRKSANRIIWQYRGAEKFIQWIKILPNIGFSIQDACSLVVRMINVDSASGDQLDVCGRIAGIDERPRILAEDVANFGYAGTPGAVGYGEGPYRSGLVEPETVPLPDFLFRILIKAKIFKNNSTATIDDIKEAVDIILDEDSYVIDGQDMSIQTVWVMGNITPTLRKLVEDYDIIPRPQGVKVRRFDQLMEGFGYAGTLGAEKYGKAPYVNGEV